MRFYQLLVAARKRWFIDALSDALGQLDQAIVKQQIAQYVPNDVQKLLAAAGLRDEHVFPVPAVIEAKPSLVGYYRLLLGAPQKSFYKGSTGMGRFKRMEGLDDPLRKAEKHSALDFCRAMIPPLAELVRQIPEMSERDLHELPLLTFGSQLQGSHNTLIGQTAMKEVFVAITDLVGKHAIEKTEKKLILKNSVGRTVLITLSRDPDVAIQERVGDSVHQLVAVEVKGGTDISNAHNRAGEAEKSHQKAKNRGFPQFWTLISKQGLDPHKLQAESPTTNHWFDIAQVLVRKGADWEEFQRRLAGTIGIPLAR